MLSSTRIEFWTRPRLRFLLRLFSALAALSILLHQLPDLLSGRPILDGDFATFFAGGWLAVNNPAALYDVAVNTSLQNSIWPGFKGSSVSFFYPPPYAALLRPLSFFSPNTARAIFIALHLFFFFAACRLLYPLLGTRRPATLGAQERLNQVDFFCLLLLFYPMLVGLLGGQNSPFSLLLYAIMLNKIQQGDQRSEFQAGLACGLWLIKPNYPMLFLVGMLAARRWRFIGGATVSALCLYILGVAQSGWLWPIEWLRTISNLTADEVYSNAYRYNSIGGLLTGTAIWFGRADLVPILRAVALSVGVLIAGWCAIRFAKTFCGDPTDKTHDSGEKLQLFALLGPLSLLVAPHSFFYDTVLCLPAALLWLPANSDRQVTLIAALLLLVVNFSNNQQGLPVNPLILMVFGSALLGLRAIDQPELADKK